ncbi:MAG: leucine-rich repeat protein [Bacteroides sp.]|nr:leucine-rich repeat protein [Bacteroides sp.]
MKHILNFLLLICTLHIVSCSSENLQEKENLFENNKITTIGATISSFEMEDIESRISISMGKWPNFGDVVWAEGDTIGIYPSIGDQLSFPIVEGIGKKYCEFNGGGWALKTSSSYTAYTPFNRSYYQHQKNDALPISMLNQKQIGNNNSDHIAAYDIQIAKGTTPTNGKISFDFQHQVSFVRMDLIAPCAATWKSITLESDAAFTTKAKMDLSLETPTITPTLQTNSVTLDLENVNTNDSLHIVAYMMMLPVDFTDKTLEVILTDADDNIYTAPATIVNNKFNFTAASARWINAEFEEHKSSLEGGYADGTVTIETAGTMKKLLGSDVLSINSLKIVGSINGDDIRLLRQMLGASEFDTSEQGILTTLDLTETQIVEGGEWYYSQGTYDVEYYYTSDNAIGKYMFYGCSKLTNIKLSNNITFIGKSAFADCPLSRVYITSLSAWCKIDFEDANSNPLYYGSIMGSGKELYLNNNLVTELTIPNDVTEIKNYTFSGCKSITKVNIPNGVISIGNHAFYNCRSLASVTIGNDVVSIGEYAFWWCRLLKDLTIGKKVTSIGNHAFQNCESLTNLNIPENVYSIDEYAFDSCKSLQNLVIPNNVVAIGEKAFQYCESLKNVEIGDGISSISDAMFYGCKSLSVVTIGKGIEEIGSSVFYGCSIVEFCCHTHTPPALHFQGLDGICKDGKLFVPTGCSEAYKDSRWVNYFKEIIELNQ